MRLILYMFLASQAHAISAQEWANEPTWASWRAERSNCDARLWREAVLGKRDACPPEQSDHWALNYDPCTALSRQPQSSPALFAFCTTTSDKVEPTGRPTASHIRKTAKCTHAIHPDRGRKWGRIWPQISLRPCERDWVPDPAANIELMDGTRALQQVNTRRSRTLCSRVN
jgi:hypothetical protein